MKVIEKIEIKYFRSFDGGRGQPKVEIMDLKDINIFSGTNDSGKSNILRALNLFFNDEISPGVKFNLERDLSKIQKNRSDDKIEKKRVLGKKGVRQRDLWVKIRLYFRKDKGGVLPESFFVEKTWDKNGLNPNRKHNIEKDPNPQKATAQEGQLSQFLNNICFEYVPAVKDRQFFNVLFKKLQNYLFDKQDKKNDNKFTEHSSKFNDLLKNETQGLFDEFKKNTGINAGFRIPNTLVDFFRTLGVETESGISLFDRGDGIQARFIPDILNEISKDSRKKIIWGFEEPENSYEPLKCFELAQDFKKYSKGKQIFITSHAFPFIGLKGNEVSSYRVENRENTSKIGKIDWQQRTIRGVGFENNTDKLEKEIGLLNLYSQLSEHLGKQLDRNTNYIFVEDKDRQIYKISWLKLNDISFSKNNFERIFDEKCSFSIYTKNGRNNLQKFLNLPLEEHKNNKIIGIFDFDEGFENFNGLKKDEGWLDYVGSKESCITRKNTKYLCCHALLIPVPISRNNYADSSYINNYLCLEHLFEDDTLKRIDCFNKIYEPSGGSQIVKIKGKLNLWKKIVDLPKEDFKNFKPLFDKINELFELEQPKKKE
jgi:hypothetical protein